MTKDYRVTVKVRNNRILKAMEAAGLTPGLKWCASVGLSYVALNRLINMTDSPLLQDGSLRDVASKLCDLLNVIPDDLWSYEQLFPLERNFSSMEMDHAEIVAMLPDSSVEFDTSALENKQVGALLNKAIATLSKREQTILNMRFKDDMTLLDVGSALGITRGRVLQIEKAALRKMRAPVRLGIYVDCLDDVDDKQRAEVKQKSAEFLKYLEVKQ